jgi:hypothetical protein
MEFWIANDPNDKQPIPLIVESMAGNQLTQSKLKTKNSLASTKSGSVKETKKISETVERVEKDTEFVFNMQFEDRAYEIKTTRPTDQPQEQFDRFIQMLSHRFEDKEDNNDNRTLF